MLTCNSVCKAGGGGGARGGAVGRGTALQARGSPVRFSMGSLELFIDLIPSAAPWPLGRLRL
jgi:hypothetical protein